MASDERIPVTCPKCGQSNYFDKSALCGKAGDVYRDWQNQPIPAKRRVQLFGTCYECEYDFSQHTIRINCEGYEE